MVGVEVTGEAEADAVAGEAVVGAVGAHHGLNVGVLSQRAVRVAEFILPQVESRLAGIANRDRLTYCAPLRAHHASSSIQIGEPSNQAYFSARVVIPEEEAQGTR
jgi:hypothetical protein